MKTWGKKTGEKEFKFVSIKKKLAQLILNQHWQLDDTADQ